MEREGTPMRRDKQFWIVDILGIARRVMRNADVLCNNIVTSYRPPSAWIGF